MQKDSNKNIEYADDEKFLFSVEQIRLSDTEFKVARPNRFPRKYAGSQIRQFIYLARGTCMVKWTGASSSTT